MGRQRTEGTILAGEVREQVVERNRSQNDFSNTAGVSAPLQMALEWCPLSYPEQYRGLASRTLCLEITCICLIELGLFNAAFPHFVSIGYSF